MRQTASFTPYSSTQGAMSIGVKQYNAAFQSPWPLPDPSFASEESLGTVRAWHVVLELEDQGIERGRMKHRKTEDLAEVRVELLEKQRSGDKLMYRH